MTHYDSKKGVNNGLSCEVFLCSFSYELDNLLKIPLCAVQYIHPCITLE